MTAGTVLAAFSKRNQPENPLLEELPPEKAAALSSISLDEASKRMQSGHKCFSYAKKSGLRRLFWAGLGGSVDYGTGKKEFSPGQRYFYGFEPHEGFDEEDLDTLLLASGSSISADLVPKLLLCAEGLVLEAASRLPRLFAIAKCLSTAPNLECSALDLQPNRMADLARTTVGRVPLLSGTLSDLISQLGLRRYSIVGQLDGMPARVLFRGPLPLARFYSGLLFGRFRGGFVEGRTAGRTIGRHQMEADWRFHDCGDLPGALRVPAFIRIVLEAKGSFDEYVSTLPSSALKDIIKIRKRGYSSFISKDPLDFLIFFTMMYEPISKTRHGQHSIAQSLHQTAGYFESGMILFTEAENQIISAMLIHIQGRRLIAKYYGVTMGDQSLVKAGSNAASTFFFLKHGFDLGFKCLDFGLSGPFGSDGVLPFKLKWRGRMVVDAGSPVLYLRFDDEETRKRFLSVCQPILMEGLEQVRLGAEPDE